MQVSNSAQDCAVYADEISDSDIIEAMKEIEGYIDITPEDLRDIYRHAYRHVLTKVIPRNETVSGEVTTSEKQNNKTAAPGLFQFARKYTSSSSAPSEHQQY